MKNIIIFRIGSIGDYVVCLPVLHRIRMLYPKDNIVLLTNVPIDGGILATSGYQLLINSGLVNEYVEFRIQDNFYKKFKRLRKLFSERSKGNNFYYLAPNRNIFQSVRDLIFLRIICKFNVIGLTLSGNSSNITLDNNYVEPEYNRLFRLIFGFNPREIDLNFSLNINNLDYSDYINSIILNKNFITISLGTKQIINYWDDLNWIKLLSAINNFSPNVLFIAMGSSSEFDKTTHICEAANIRFINLCGRLRVRESAIVLKNSLLAICHDSGPMHLAYASGTKVIGLFSNNNPPGMWYPYKNELNVFQAEKNLSINSINPIAVADRVRKIIHGE